MKRILILRWALAAMLSSVGSLQAQETPAAPAAPYLAPVPVRGHWMISLRGPTPAASDKAAPSRDPKLVETPPFPSRIEVMTDGNMMRTILMQSDGSEQVFDQQDGYLMFSSPVGVRVVYGGERRFRSPYYANGFLFAEWLRGQGLAAFKETVLYHQVLCFHYQNAGSEVWIDPSTMYPVAAKQDGIEADYHFLPATALTFPEKEKTALTKTETAVETLRSVR
jgi:hypothetical protein